eukprot:gene20827-25015_t
MNAPVKIEGSVENWESGALGRDRVHAKRAPKELEQQMDEAQGLQAISIRLKKELIEDFKFIAKQHGMGYQPLMREALRRFAESEYKRIAVQLANEKAAKEAACLQCGGFFAKLLRAPAPTEKPSTDIIQTLRCNSLNLMVGARRFELPTPCTPCMYATRLRYAPTR